MSTFVLTGAKVIYTDDSGNTFALDPRLTIYPHPREDNLVVIGNEVDVVTDDDLIVDYTAVTTPTAGTRAAFVIALSAIFTAPAPTPGLPAGAATEAEQTAQTAELGEIKKNTGRFFFDAAGALEVSEKTILANGLQHNNRRDDIYDTVEIGGGTAVYDAAQSGTVMSVTTTGDAVIRKSFRHYPYFAGKSQKPEFTMVNMGLEADVIKTFGYYSASTTAPYVDNPDGYYFRADGVAMTHVIGCRNLGVEQFEFPRSQWDDSLDGSGASGIDIDFDDFTIYPSTFLWLGGSAINFYIKYGNDLILFHTYEHSKENKPTVMFQSPFQPVTFEIRSVGGAGSMVQICSTVSTAAKAEGVGFSRSFDTGNDFIACASPTSQYLLAAVRLADRNADATIISFSTMEVNKKTMRYRLLINPTIVGKVLTWDRLSASSSIERAIGDPAGTNIVTGGEQIDVVFQEKDGSVLGTVNSLTKIGTQIDGTPQVIALVASPVNTTNAEVFAGETIIENN